MKINQLFYIHKVYSLPSKVKKKVVGGVAWSSGQRRSSKGFAVANFYFLSFDGSARQLEIDGSVSDRKKGRKRKQLESDGSARQLK